MLIDVRLTKHHLQIRALNIRVHNDEAGTHLSTTFYVYNSCLLVPGTAAAAADKPPSRNQSLS